MRGILALCGALLLAGAFALWRWTRPQLVYGEFTGAPRIAVGELIAAPKARMGKVWAIEGIISKQCTTMGCFFFIQDAKGELRVDLEEIAMNAPKNRNGRPARAEGQIVPYGDGYELMATAVEFK